MQSIALISIHVPDAEHGQRYRSGKPIVRTFQLLSQSHWRNRQLESISYFRTQFNLCINLQSSFKYVNLIAMLPTIPVIYFACVLWRWVRIRIIIYYAHMHLYSLFKYSLLSSYDLKIITKLTPIVYSCCLALYYWYSPSYVVPQTTQRWYRLVF